MSDAKKAHTDAVIAASRRDREDREAGYRERALKIYPWICGRCSREFTRTNLRELTVHHKDHNHNNNPSDGSNWELLCLYCHDNEHGHNADATAAAKTGDAPTARRETSGLHEPFAGVAGLLNKKKDGE